MTFGHALGYALVYLAVFLVGVLVYFLPTIIAGNRRHRNQLAIFVLNLLLGFTMLGWIAALVWAVWNEKERPRPIHARAPSGSANRDEQLWT